MLEINSLDQLTKVEACLAFRHTVEFFQSKRPGLKGKKMAEDAGMDLNRFNRILYSGRKPEEKDLETMETRFAGFKKHFFEIASEVVPNEMLNTEDALKQALAQIQIITREAQFWQEKFLDEVKKTKG